MDEGFPTLPTDLPDTEDALSMPLAPELPPSTVDWPAGTTGKPTAPLAVPDYELLGELGRGAMGVVYKAWQISLKRLVALKMILSPELAGADEVLRMRHEAEALARVQHPHIVQIFEIGEFQGRPFLALEFCPGGSLSDRLRGTPLTPRQAAELTETLARAMQAAHAQGVVHRDLKPANVLLVGKADDKSPLSQPKISDFGLAKRLDLPTGRTQSGAVMGTPSYMAPEQAAGRPRDTGPHSDVYALGAILYELLTGGPPFRGATLWETIRCVLNEDPVPPSHLQPSTPRDLETICLKCLHKEPARRYARAEDLADDLRRWLEGKPVLARPVGKMQRLVKWVRRRPADAAVLAVTVVAAVFLVALSIALLQVNLLKESKDSLAQEVKNLEGIKERSTAEIEAGRREVNRLEKVAGATAYANTLAEVQAAARESRYPLMPERLARCLPRRGKEDLRHFEWHYFNRLYHSEKHSFVGQNCVAFAPEGPFVLAAESGKSLALVHYPSGRRVGAFAGLTAQPIAAAYSPDGKTLAAVSRDGKLAFWHAQPGKPLRLLAQKQGELAHVAAGPDGWFAVSGLGVIKLWRATPERITEEFTLKGHVGTVFAAAFSPDGKFLVSAGADGTARVWDLSQRVEVDQLNGIKGGVSAVAFSPAGDQVAVARMVRQKTMEIYDGTTWKKRRELHGHTQTVRALAFSADGRILCSAGEDRVIRVWDVRGGSLRSVLPGHQASIAGLTFCTNPGRTDSLASVGSDRTVKIWDVTAPPPPLRTVGGHNAAVMALAFSPDSKRLASGDCYRNPTVCVHDVRTGAPSPNESLPQTGWPSALGFTADGKSLLAGGANPLRQKDSGDLRRWDLEEVEGVPFGHIAVGPNTVIAIAAERMAVTSKGGRIRVYDGKGVQIADLSGHGQQVTALALSADGTRLASTGSDRVIRVRQAPSGRLLDERPTRQGDVGVLALSADGKQLAWAASGSAIRLSEVGDDRPPLELPGHEQPVHALAFSPDGKRLASASQDRTVRLWDTFAGWELLRLAVPWSQIQAVAFSPDGNYLAAGGGWADKGQVMIWNGTPVR